MCRFWLQCWSPKQIEPLRNKVNVLISLAFQKQRYPIIYVAVSVMKLLGSPKILDKIVHKLE